MSPKPQLSPPDHRGDLPLFRPLRHALRRANDRRRWLGAALTPDKSRPLVIEDHSSAGPTPPRDPPNFQLRHGEVLLILARLGFRGTVHKQTFHEYIKSLRKLGSPFDPAAISLGRRRLIRYSYYHVMELALILSLRVYHVIPDALLRKIVQHRPLLYPLYARAYTERSAGLGAPLALRFQAEPSLEIRGVFLDLQIDFSGGVLTKFGPPRLLGPGEALRAFAGSRLASRAFVPLNLSSLAERVVAAAMTVPVVRRGRRPGGVRLQPKSRWPAVDLKSTG